MSTRRACQFMEGFPWSNNVKNRFREAQNCLPSTIWLTGFLFWYKKAVMSKNKVIAARNLKTRDVKKHEEEEESVQTSVLKYSTGLPSVWNDRGFQRMYSNTGVLAAHQHTSTTSDSQADTLAHKLFQVPDQPSVCEARNTGSHPSHLGVTEHLRRRKTGMKH